MSPTTQNDSAVATIHHEWVLTLRCARMPTGMDATAPTAMTQYSTLDTTPGGSVAYTAIASAPTTRKRVGEDIETMLPLS